MSIETWPFGDTWSLHENKEIASRYEILERIGEGTFGEVYRARRREDNHIVAIKEVHDSESSYREVKALLLLDHPNVVKLYEYFVQGSNMVLVLEYLPSNLYEVIRAGHLSEAEIKGWSIQILRGLSACHAASIIHRDLKPANLLIAEDGTLKIADFGTARVLKDSETDEYVYGSEMADEDVLASMHKKSEVVERKEESDLQGCVPSSEAKTEGVPPAKDDNVPLRNVDAEASAGPFCLRNHKRFEKESAAIPGEGLQSLQDSRFGDSEYECTALRNHAGSERNSCVLQRNGCSASAENTDDCRRYLGVEKMVRTESGRIGRGFAGLQSIRSQVEDPGCCGWFSSENEENAAELTGSEPLRTGLDPAIKAHGNLGKEVDVLVLDKDVSLDESGGGWKEQHRMQKDWVVTQEKHKHIHDAGLSHVKTEGDIFQKFHRFLTDRARRLNSEDELGNKDILSDYEKVLLGEGKSWTEESCKNWYHTATVTDVSSGEKALMNAEGFSSDVGGSPLAHQDNGRQKERGGRRTVPGQNSILGEGTTSQSMAGQAFVPRHSEDYCLQKIAVGQASNGRSVMENVHSDEIVDVDVRRNFKDVNAVKSLQGSLRLRSASPKPVPNGPLMEMAYASGREGSGADEPLGDDGGSQVMCSTSPEIYSEDEMRESLKNARWLDSLRKSDVNDFAWCAITDQEPTEIGTLSVGMECTSSPHEWTIKCENLYADGRGAIDYSGERQNGQELGDGSARYYPSGKEVEASGEQVDEHESTLSDAEGTRWFGAPRFQYSYMEERNGDPSNGEVSVETGRVDSDFDEEWEDGIEGGADKSKGGFSHDSTDRGDNVSDNGSAFTTMVGTRWYKAPELLYGARKYGTEMDIWAFGCIFGELLSGGPLFAGTNDIDQLSRLVRILGSPTETDWKGISLLPDYNKICFVDDRSPLTLRNYLPNVSENSLQFLMKLLTYDPARRPTAAESEEDDYFLKDPLPCPPDGLKVPTPEEKNNSSDEEWGEWKDIGSPFSDFEILG